MAREAVVSVRKAEWVREVRKSPKCDGGGGRCSGNNPLGGKYSPMGTFFGSYKPVEEAKDSYGGRGCNTAGGGDRIDVTEVVGAMEKEGNRRTWFV